MLLLLRRQRWQQPDERASRRTDHADYNVHDATINRPEWCCNPFGAQGTSPDPRISVARIAPTAHVRLLVSLLEWAAQSQRVGRSDACSSPTSTSRMRPLAVREGLGEAALQSVVVDELLLS